MKNFVKFKKNITVLFTLMFLFATCLVFGPNVVFADSFFDSFLGPPAIETKDTRLKRLISGIDKSNKAKEKEDKVKQNLGSKLYYSTLSKALGMIAYDTATWIGSGGEGQKPLFIKEGWREYLVNVSDNAAGKFIETLGKENGYLEFDLCEPSFAGKFSINLGLHSKYSGRDKPACTFSEMRDNWEAELNRPDFLSRFKTVFKPESNDVGIALSAHTKIIEEQAISLRFKSLEREEGDSWLDVRDIAGDLKSPPGWAKREANDLKGPLIDNFGQISGDILVDAANIFLNQLAITAINNLMRSLGRDLDTYTSPYSWDNPDAGPIRGGIVAAKERFRKIIEPIFDVRGDYNILSELSVCPDPNKAGPTNCVLDDQFQSAIEAKLTVAEAMEEGYLKKDGVFGFLSGNDLEPNYIEGYPYRSMKILRKFRIIPVGWELAAQYIAEHPEDVGGVKTLEDLVVCYDGNDPHIGQDDYQEVWCKGLVDPNWVLKAPLNYCGREGPGPEIVSEEVLGSGEDSYLSIKRNENYCADEQACIQENQDGSCEYYGYCTEERRKWDFDGESCNPLYNTCQTYRSSGGQTVSYLNNTLDYGSCGADNAGCLAYCEEYDNVNNFKCNGVNDAILRADAGIEACDYSSEGCHEFIRFKPGLGSNLLINSSFEDYDGIANNDDGGNIDNVAEIGLGDWEIISEAYIGNSALHLMGVLDLSDVFGPDSWMVGGQGYTFSFYAKDCSANADDTAGLGVNGDDETITIASHPDWRFYTLSKVFSDDVNTPTLNIKFNINDTCDIDGLKLEMGAEATVWSDYRDNGLVYQKLAPDHLTCDGDSDPSECSRFVRECTIGEFGCDLYTAQSDGMTIPARVANDDYCPGACVGYDEYVQRSSSFDSETLKKIIPNTARNCNAQAVGCDEFTNLDRIGEGAEAREYYSELKQCVIETEETPNPDCSAFYTWEGSSETGYQLRVFRLKADGSGEPILTNNGLYNDLDCASTTYDLEINPMCREFYDPSGERFYEFLPYVITCSNNCHPYRRSVKNILPSIVEAFALCQSDCGGNPLCLVECSNTDDCNIDSGSRICEFDDGKAVYCKDGGLWRYDHQSCLYQAIPDEGVKCNASAAGCREYTGPSGYNIRRLFADNFESGHTDDWTGLNTIEPSSESLLVGGHSLYVNNPGASTSKDVHTIVRTGKTYILRFIARSPLDQIITAYFASTTASGADIATTSFNGQAEIDSEWQIFELNSNIIERDIWGEEVLIIAGTDEFYIDDIQLIEVTDRYYLITDPWNTPDVCYKDIFGNGQGEDFNLGCEIYIDRDDNINYIHSFSNLCQDDAVGCELMIDTNNYDDSASSTWFGSEQADCDVAINDDCREVEEDEYKYVVYNSDKLCNSTEKGCQLLGSPYNYEDTTLYSSVYLKNDPNEYGRILCEYQDENCAAWTMNNSSDYFKDPGDMVCEWRTEASGNISNSAWYKKKIKRCDENDNGSIELLETSVCQNDNDCSAGFCILDENNHPCEFDKLKTIGYGGYGNVISQPTMDGDNNWVGLCPADESGCSEYIDPISRFNPNTIFNASFADLDGDGNPADGWSGSSQRVDVEPYTLYRFGGKGTGDSILDCDNPIYWLSTDNMLNDTTNPRTFNIGAIYQSRLVYTDSNTVCTTSVENATEVDGREIELREVVVDYQLQQELDQGSCTGLVEYDNGCVLFNKRTFDKDGCNELDSDADHSIGSTTSAPPVAGVVDADNDSNVVLKVTPNRICDKWLACKSYVKEDEETICYDLGLCDSLNRSGNCDSFVIEKKKNQSYALFDGGYFANKSGYSLSGLMDSQFETDYYPVGEMEQVGNVAQVANGGFEVYGDNNYPISWMPVNSSWDENDFRVISNPFGSERESIERALKGRSFLKLGFSHMAVSEFINVEQNTEYTLSAFINTINLYEGEARISVQKYDCSGSRQGGSFDVHGASLSSGEKWTFVSGRFNILGTANRIKLTLYVDSPGDVEGNFYFDDIKLRPALNVRDIIASGNTQYVSQTCRLYPKDDALSCEYFEESGIKNKGIYGYCLEYDRAPGSKDTCILWYPVDRVKGDGIEGGAGYNGKMPVYYCTDAIPIFGFQGEWKDWLVPKGGSCGDIIINNDRFNAYMNTDEPDGLTGGGCDGDYGGLRNRPPGWGGGTFNDCPGNCADTRQSDYLLPSPITTDANDRSWYYLSFYNDHLSDDVLESGDSNWSVYNDNGFEFRIEKPDSFRTGYMCTEFSRTVGSLGRNKFWNGRVRECSDYTFFCQKGFPIEESVCSYITDDAPFGSAIITGDLNEIVNPQKWDLLLYQKEDYSEDHMGRYHTSSQIQKLFAQSYGIWKWDGNRYTKDERNNWGPPGVNEEPNNGLCGGTGAMGSRNLFSGDIFHAFQNGVVNEDFPATFAKPNRAEDFYNYSDGSFSNPNMEPLAKANRSVIFVHSNSLNDQLSLGIFHGSPDSNSDNGNVDFTFSSITPGNRVAVTDDPGDASNSGIAINGGLNNGAVWNWNYGASCTDGGMIEMPSSDWSVTIDPDFIAGIDEWVLFYIDSNDNLESVNLNMNRTLTIYSMMASGDYCSIIPIVENIKVNKNDTGNVTLGDSNDIINLTFNSIIDSQQLPLVMYAIDWGDSKTVVSGTEMRDKPNEDNPHSLYHLYSYWELRSKWAVDQDPEDENRVYCGSANNEAMNFDDAGSGYTCGGNNCCVIKPKVKIKDNWGWCSCNAPDPVANCDAAGENCTDVDDLNPGCQINNCTNDYNWEPFGHYIVVTE
ncbi:MAG: hypothetical protein U9Q85_02985 [Patescibacteria group bacterium]|nr:hypothetical protein [Patescibacteria group bacterium]